MTVDLRPYPVYRDSGVEWLGDVPEHWEVRRIKWAATLNPSKKESRSSLAANTPVTFLPMECVNTDGCINSREAPPASTVWNGFTYFRRGDILVAKITPCFENGKGACLDTLPTDFGFGSTEFHVLRARSSISPQFLYRITNIAEFRRLGADAMTGAAGQQRVPESFLANFPIPLPPLPEQTAIVRFLDHVDRRIRRSIRAKQKLITLLNEQKQAVIHHAVTRGLDPNVPLKPSGVEWLGEVPEHWEVVALRRVTTSRCDGPFGSGLKSTHYVDSGVRVIRLQNIGHAQFKNADAAYISEEHYAKLGDHSVITGDLLIAGLGDEKIPPGRACVAPEGIEPAMVKADCFRFRLDPRRVLASFAALQLTSTALAAASVLSAGATRQRINLKSMSARPIMLPSLIEQSAIVHFLDEITTTIDHAITTTQREITLLKEYRTRLIADVVTGKLDVRAAAADLPDEVEEPEPFDGGDVLDVSDEDVGDLDAEAEVVEA